MDEGGETVFPNAADQDKVTGPEWSDCAKRGLAVKAKKGDALLFFRYEPCKDQCSRPKPKVQLGPKQVRTRWWGPSCQTMPSRGWAVMATM